MVSTTIWAPKGETGDKGPPGDQGPVGPQGPAGPDTAQFAADIANKVDPNKGAHLIGYKGVTLDSILDIYPENYGAIGDGIANDAPAWAAAIAACPTYGRIRMKRGSIYKIVDGFTVNKAGITIEGEGARLYYPQTSQGYYHGIIVSAADVNLLNIFMYSDAALVRGNTGFGVSVFTTARSRIINCTFVNIASAAIWVTNSEDVLVEGCSVVSPKADGIHFSDGCRKCRAANNRVTGAADDSIAVVGDVPGDGLNPHDITIIGNTISDNVAGHGVVLIACDSVVVVGNSFNNLTGPAIGSYFWQLISNPTDSDWANNCLIEGNVGTITGRAPLSADGACAVYAGSFRNSTIRGNKFSGGQETAGLTAVIRLGAWQNLNIENNDLRDSSSYGIWADDTNVNGATNTAGLVVKENSFYNIVKSPVRLRTAATNIGRTFIVDNTFIDCAYTGSFTLVDIFRTGTNLLNITGNKNLSNNRTYAYDAASCTNVAASSNTPDIVVSFSPGASAISGSFTSVSSSGTYTRTGNYIFGHVIVLVPTVGTGSGVKFNLPFPVKSGAPPAQFVGREVAVLGKSLIGTLGGTTVVNMYAYDNSTAAPGNGSNLDITFFYLADLTP